LENRTLKFPPTLLDDIRARLSVSQVVSRKVALKKAGREWKGLSPFKVEKTPSFYVNDQKGFYHCFASGEHGDIFKFVMKTEGLTFPEAVERLAEEAGVPIPKFEPVDREREDRRERLLKLMEAAALFFEQALAAPQGTTARRYVVETRGLSTEAIRRFRLGFAPSSRNALKEHLGGLGFSTDEMITSGMLIGGDDIPVAYDRFRNRVMFPITDMKNRVIAFGGRALDADAPAKYLNSPETPLFHKGHVLFHAAGARGPAHDRARIIAVEGYMDVVALASAGFMECVAPLGTALTEDQVRLLWRMANEPILCFDGDTAGKKAAWRAVDVVLPHLVPGKSLRFAFMPDGLDPDDLIRRDGPAAMEAVLDDTRSLSEVLFDREWASGDWSTPERRAKLEKQIFELVGRIADETVRGHYLQDMHRRLGAALGVVVGAPAALPAPHGSPGQAANAPRNRDGWQSNKPRPGYPQDRRNAPGRGAARPVQRNGRWAPPDILDTPLAASDSLRQSALGAHIPPTGEVPPREAILLMTLVNHPWLIEERWEDVSRLDFSSHASGRLRDSLLDLQAYHLPLDSIEIRTQLTRLGFERTLALIERSITHRSDRFVAPDADRAEVDAGWGHALRLHEQDRLRHALVEAEAAYRVEQTDDTLARLMELKRLQARAIDGEERA
jgi:DNA primase